MFDYSKLKGRIIEKVGNNCNFAIKLGCSERTLSLKLNNKIDFKQSEILKSCKILSIPTKDIKDYFFNYIVQNIEQ